MNEEQEKELLQKIELLSSEVAACRREVAMLKQLLAGNRQRPTGQQAPPKSPTIENFVGLKLIHIAGIIVLFIGLSIGVKYAIDINLITPALRILLAYAAGMALFLLSIRLRKKYSLFSMILFSGAMATIYFTTYGAYEFYNMMPRSLAFGIMLALTIFTAYNALKYNSPQIAILGMVGAYAIPFFVRGNSSDITALLGYILIINLGILFLSFKKYWLSLNYIAFVSTWIIFGACLYTDNSNTTYTSSLIVFAFVFFVLFTLSTLGFKLFKKQAVDINDVLLVSFNIVLLYGWLNILFSRITASPQDNLSLVFGIILIAAAFISLQLLKQQPVLNGCLFLMGVLALATYIALHFEGFTITIVWVIMAISLFVTGMLGHLKVLRIAAILLFGATLLKLLLLDSDKFTAVQKVIAYIFTGAVLLVVSFLYQRFRKMIFGEEEH